MSDERAIPADYGKPIVAPSRRIPVESDKQAAPVSAPPDEVDVAHDNVGRAWTGDKHRVPERDVPSKVSAGEVKRWNWDCKGMVEHPSGKFSLYADRQRLEADHLSAMKAMQERIATLEAELLQTTKEKMAAERDKNRAESELAAERKAQDELAAFKASLPERAEKMAQLAYVKVWGTRREPEHRITWVEVLSKTFLAEMQREKE